MFHSSVELILGEKGGSGIRHVGHVAVNYVVDFRSKLP